MYVIKRGKLTYAIPFTHAHTSIGSPYVLDAPDTSMDTDHSILDGRKERVQFDKITARVSRLCYGLDQQHVDPAAITQRVISGVYQGVTTVELDNLVSGVNPYHRPRLTLV